MASIRPFAGVSLEVPIMDRLAELECAAQAVNFTGLEIRGHIAYPDQTFVVTPKPGTCLLVAHSGMTGYGDEESRLYTSDPAAYETDSSFVGHVLVPTMTIEGLRIAVRSYTQELGLKTLRTQGFQHNSGHFHSTEFGLRDGHTIGLQPATS